MNPAPKSLQWLVWGGMTVTIAAIVVAFVVQKIREADRGPGAQPGSELAVQAGGPLPVLFEVPDFALTNQGGQVVTRADLRGQVWIADIIFTSCAGPCPEMTRRMSELQGAIPATAAVKFVTLTTHPEFDTPAVLLAYSRRFHAEAGRWHFLTGGKRQIIDLAVGGLKLTALEKEPDKQENPNDLFIHSTLFVILDRRGRARAVVESDDAEMKPKVLRAVGQLLKEE
jgi:cytochrome oxidase Cu insertion factor (SCO1/SenC/PrrC family)